MAATSESNNPYQTNPFTPVFGEVPAYLAGRESIIEDMAIAFDYAGSNPNLSSIFVGPRGSGKTSLLSYLSSEAQRYGWVSVNVTSSKGMLEDILQRIFEKASDFIDQPDRVKLTGIEVAAIGGISWEHAAPRKPNWRTEMNAILDNLAKTNVGIAICVDEVDPTLDEMVQLVTTYQHFIREGRKVALLMAGLPYNVSKLLSGKSTSFLRRAARHDLGPIPRYEVEEAFRLTVQSGNRSIRNDALALAADCINGFPYMFQLLGYRAWNAAGTNTELCVDDVKRGNALAIEELRSRVYAETLAELSKSDIAFARAIAANGEEATREAVTERLGKPSSHISTYKRRLLESGIIDEPVPGRFAFALPGFGAYLRELYG